MPLTLDLHSLYYLESKIPFPPISLTAACTPELVQSADLP